MEDWIAIIITVGLLINIILSFKEGKDERWKHITIRPLNYAFSILFLGYAVSNIISERYNFDLNAYRKYYDYLFAGVLLI